MSSSTFLVWLLFAVNSQNVIFSLDLPPKLRPVYPTVNWTSHLGCPCTSNLSYPKLNSSSPQLQPPDETHPFPRVPYLSKRHHSTPSHQSGSYPRFSLPLTPISGRSRSLSPTNCNSQMSSMLSCSLHSSSPTSCQSLYSLSSLECFQCLLPPSSSNHPSNFWILSHYSSAQNSSVAPHCFQAKIWAPATRSQTHSQCTQMYSDTSLLCFLELIWSCSQWLQPAG